MRNTIIKKPLVKLTCGFVFLILLSQVFRACQTAIIPPKLIKESYISVYPPAAYTEQVEGTVLLLVHIDQNGMVTDAYIRKSSGYPVLDSSAIALAKTSHFSPGLIGGTPQEVWMTWPIVYRFTSLTMDVERWQHQVFIYQRNIAKNPDDAFTEINLFSHYVRMANYQSEKRDLTINAVLLDVVAPEIRNSWKVYEEVWPLPFILFWDYLHKYPQSNYTSLTRDYLMESTQTEIEYLKSGSRGSATLDDQMKNEIILKIEKLYQSAKVIQLSNISH